MVLRFYLNKRAYDRIPVTIRVSCLFNNESYSGTVRNLSINGMYLEAEGALPVRSKMDVLNPFKSYCIVYIPLADTTMKVIVKVRRQVKSDSDCTCMGVELVNPSQEYLELVSSIRKCRFFTVRHQSLAQLKNNTT